MLLVDGRKRLNRLLVEGATVLLNTAEQLDSELNAVALTVCRTLREGHKILVCGNGGSAADAQHFAAELVGRYKGERQPLAAIALTVDSSVLTCIGNDYGYLQVFSRQVLALGKPGDVLLAISTSGKSPNVLEAVYAGNDLGLLTVGLTGASNSPLFTSAQMCLRVPSTDTALIQQAHTAILHGLCELLEEQV